MANPQNNPNESTGAGAGASHSGGQPTNPNAQKPNQGSAEPLSNINQSKPLADDLPMAEATIAESDVIEEPSSFAPISRELWEANHTLAEEPVPFDADLFPAGEGMSKSKDDDVGDRPLLPPGEEVTHFFTRGRVIAAIAIILVLSFSIDRFSAKAPNTAAEPSRENLALVTADAPGPSATTPGKINIYFNNSLMDSTAKCDKVFPVLRQIQDPSPESAMKLLLAGPTPQESDEGYFTSISPGVKLLGADIVNDAAAAEFDAHLVYNVAAGSCRAIAIQAQIAQTLGQFTGVKDVKILVGGTDKNILAK